MTKNKKKLPTTTPKYLFELDRDGYPKGPMKANPDYKLLHPQSLATTSSKSLEIISSARDALTNEVRNPSSYKPNFWNSSQNTYGNDDNNHQNKFHIASQNRR